MQESEQESPLSFAKLGFTPQSPCDVTSEGPAPPTSRTHFQAAKIAWKKNVIDFDRSHRNKVSDAWFGDEGHRHSRSSVTKALQSSEVKPLREVGDEHNQTLDRTFQCLPFEDRPVFCGVYAGKHRSEFFPVTAVSAVCKKHGSGHP